MKTPVEIFEEWLKIQKLKPRFHPIPANIAVPFIDQKNLFKIRTDQLRPMFLPNRAIEIYADFIDDGTCNAVAGIHDGLGLIGITKGGILLPLDTFFRIFSHPDALAEIGNSKSERVGAQHRQGIATNYDSLVKSRKRAGISRLPTAPIDRIRQIVADICIQIALGFLVMHELVHVVHGHVGYVNKTGAFPFMLEVLRPGTSATPSKTDVDRQSIEVWADSKAISVVLNGFLKSGGERLDSIFPEPEHKIFIWSFAMFAVFRIWGLEVDPSDLAGYDHPPTALRLQMAMLSAEANVLIIHPNLKNQFWKIVRRGQLNAEHCIRLLGGRKLRGSDIQGVEDPRCINHRNALLDHMETVLIPELKKYSYVSLHQAQSQP